jgi:hypothetical protein
VTELGDIRGYKLAELVKLYLKNRAAIRPDRRAFYELQTPRSTGGHSRTWSGSLLGCYLAPGDDFPHMSITT